MVIVGRVLRWVWRRPIATAASIAWLVAWTRLGDVRTAGLIGLIVVGLVGWRVKWPASFGRWVVEPWGRRRRRCWYRQHWHELMTGHGLHRRRWQESTVVHLATVELAGRVDVARLSRIRCGRWADRLTVRPLVGQTIDDWEAATDGLALASGARGCRVAMAARAGWLTVEFAWGDPLATTIPALAVPERVDLAALPVGRREDGTVWTLALAGSHAGHHTLIAGETGAGKSSVVWSLLRALSGAIAEGLVVVWALDPKGGMEMRAGRALFARYCDDTPEEMADLLDDAVAVMNERKTRLAGTTRDHQPSESEPLIVVLVDELAALIADLEDRKLRDRITRTLRTLLRQGRAPGVCVVAAVQDPHKDIVTIRNSFPTKIGLRLNERTEVDMVLGEGARDRGARCDQIPVSAPGVAYVRLDGIREPVRVRAAYVTDADIAAMAAAAEHRAA